MSELLPHQQRVVEEKAELDARLEKLSAFIESSSQFKALEHVDRHLLIQQETHMMKLSDILARRIKRFTKP